MKRPQEAPYKVSPAIFALKGGNLKVENLIRVITCPQNFWFYGLFSKIFSHQAPFHYIHVCILILDDLTILNPYLHLLKSFPSGFSSERKPNWSTSWCRCHQSSTLTTKLPRSSKMVNQVANWCMSVQLVSIVMPGEDGHIFFHVIIRISGGPGACSRESVNKLLNVWTWSRSYTLKARYDKLEVEVASLTEP